MVLGRAQALVKDLLERMVSELQRSGWYGDLPAVTITRSAGSGAMSIAHQLADHLNSRKEPEHPPWTVMDRDFVKRVLSDHRLPQLVAAHDLRRHCPPETCEKVVQVLKEDPTSWTVVQKATVTVRRLCAAGHVIMVGRGANLMASGLPNVLHVRLVGSVPRRIARVIAEFELTRREAADHIESTDRARSTFVTDYFGVSVDDPLQYNFVVNTDRMPDEEVVRLVGESLRGLPSPKNSRKTV